VDGVVAAVAIGVGDGAEGDCVMGLWGIGDGCEEGDCVGVGLRRWGWGAMEVGSTVGDAVGAGAVGMRAVVRAASDGVASWGVASRGGPSSVALFRFVPVSASRARACC